MELKTLLKLVVSIGLALSAGVVGSLFNSSVSSWYAALQKPSFNPPNWIFSPVWTALFVLMGISLFLIWKKGWKSREVRTAMSIFAVQLVLNILWSFFFFYLQNPLYALIEIIILWIAIAWTIKLFYNIDKRAGYLLIPYIVWVSFAVMLNLSIWLLN